VTFEGHFWRRKKVSYEAGITVFEKKCRWAVEITDLTHEKSYESRFL
jgi:hypothetical protein